MNKRKGLKGTDLAMRVFNASLLKAKTLIWRATVLLIAMAAITANSAWANGDAAAEYTLGSGDAISISVYDEEDLSLEAKLGDAGILNYPFLGKLKVAGMTVAQLQNTITEGLKGDYLIDPKVSVNVVEYRKFFVNGEVKRPGGFEFQPGLTIGKAVTLAEGFTERANKKSILITSDGDASNTPRKVDLNSPVKPGDIITIEQSFF